MGFFSHRARLAAWLALAVCVSHLSAAPARAGAADLGPGPILGLRITDRGLVFYAGSGNRDVPFSDETSVSATRGGAEWTPFDSRPSVRQGGSQLLQPGTIGGVPVEEFFGDEQPARMLVRNGDGPATELDVARFGDIIGVLRANRSLASPLATVSRSGAARVDALEDAPVRLTLETRTSASGLDVVVTASLPPLPDGASTQTPSLVAVDSSGAIHEGTVNRFGRNETTAFFHVLLDEGSYTLRLSTQVEIGNPLVSTVALAFDSVATLPIEVSGENRLFALASPPLDVPQMIDATVTIDGLDQLDPTFGNPVDVTVALVSPDERVRVAASRKVTNAGPLPVAVRLPEGTYERSVTIGRDDGTPNGRGFASTVALGARTISGDTTLSVPELVRLTGVLVDPDLVLASDFRSFVLQGPWHRVEAVPAAGGDGFRARAEMRGFTRSYELYVPRGSTARLSAGLIVEVGRPFPRIRTSENNTLALSIDDVGGAITCDAGRAVDVPVPDLPPHVRREGSVVGSRGEPARRVVVSVSITRDDGSRVGVTVVTKGAGNFRLRLPRGRGYEFRATDIPPGRLTIGG